MTALNYVGPDPVNGNDVIDLGYVTGTLEAANMTQSQVDSLINGDLSGYSKQSDVTAATSGLLTPSQLNTQVGNYVPTSSVGTNSGILALDADGKIPANKVQVASTQRWPSPFYSPSAYHSSLITTTTETQLFTCPVSNPGYAYKLLCSGLVDTLSAVDAITAYPVVNVRVNSLTGPIIAQGFGLGESYQVSTGISGSDNFNRANSIDLGTGWSMTYSNTGNGSLQIVGDIATWVKNGSGQNRLLCRRIAPADGITNTDDQITTMTWGDNVPDTVAQFSPAPDNDLYLRMSSDLKSYVRMGVSYNAIGVVYTTNGSGNEQTLISAFSNNPSPYDQYGLGVVGRVWSVYKNGVVIKTFTENTAVTNMGAAYRGWGFGAYAGNSFSTQSGPADTQLVTIADNQFAINTGVANVAPLSLAAQALTSGAVTLYVTLASGDGKSLVGADAGSPSLYVLPVPS